MAIIINKNSKVIVQGITGKEGQRATKFMQASGTEVVAGVRPGKAGEVVEGVKVFDSVQDAIEGQDMVNLVSLITVPPKFVKDAVVEAIDAGVKFVCPIAEGVPVHDTAYLLALAKSKGTTLLGPNTVGCISPGKGKIGVIGAEDNRSFSEGSVGIISKSGGMTSETARLLTLAGIGQSTCVNIGGDKLVGLDYVDCLKQFAEDEETKAVILFGEVGGTYEEQAAEYIKTSGFSKPVVAFITGKFAERWKGVPLGHAGAIIHGNKGGREYKVEVLRDAGVTVVDVHHEIVDAVKKVL